MDVPGGVRTTVPAGRCKVSCVSTSKGVPRSIAEVAVPEAGLLGESGNPSCGRRAGMRTGFLDQSMNLGWVISYSTVNGAFVAYGSDAVTLVILPRKPSESASSCATSFHFSLGEW